MSDIEKLLKEFHTVFDLTRNDYPTLPPEETKALRLQLLKEEYEELVEAIENDDLPAILQESIDLVYVTVGADVSYGLPFNAGLNLVHAANMAKLFICRGCGGGGWIWGEPEPQQCTDCFQGKIIVRSPEGKVLKPPGWKPPDIAGLLAT